MHDPLSASDVVNDEIRQRRESGYDVDHIASRVAAAGEVAEQDVDAILDELAEAPRHRSWACEEPEDLAGILGDAPADPAAVPLPDFDRFHGAWLGRIAGCNIGKPVEDGRVWTRARIRRYLELGGAYPLRDYVPALDPMPDGFALRENWPATTRGNVNGSDRDDDIDYPILGLLLLERHGTSLTTEDVADGWLAFLPYLRVYTAERAAYVNLLHGVPASAAAERRNPYREWIGALIRGDIFGWTSPGRPVRAATFAYRDARLSHRTNGVYGEMWSAALTACALVGDDVERVVERALGVVPPRSRLAEAIGTVREQHRRGATWDAAMDVVDRRYGQYEWVHSINNAAIITAGLLYSGGDFAIGVGNTVQSGYDTDSNAATVGSVLGALRGASLLPPHLIDPLHDRTRSAVFGSDHARISGLAQRTRALAAGLYGTPQGLATP